MILAKWVKNKFKKDDQCMGSSAKMLVMKIFEKCAGKSGCDVCRPHMEDDCLFFPELYRLQDECIDKGKPIDGKRVKRLVNLCTLCGLCPCQDVRMLILKTKAALANEKGLSLSTQFIADVQRAGRWGGRLHQTVNGLNKSRLISPCLKKVLKVHPDRQLPEIPKQNFFSWVKKKRDLPGKNPGHHPEKVVYFAGCSAGYFFPEVGQATVELLEKIGADVFVPEQHCCSMPLLMEGQNHKAMDKIQANVSILTQAVSDGYKLVCSCPTCGYFFKKLLLENAYFSDAAQEPIYVRWAARLTAAAWAATWGIKNHFIELHWTSADLYLKNSKKGETTQS